MKIEGTKGNSNSGQLSAWGDKVSDAGVVDIVEEVLNVNKAGAPNA